MYVQPAPGAVERAMTLMESTVRQFRDNQWIRVKGFEVTLSISPSIKAVLEVPPPAGSTPPTAR
jgi:hypothetical protein